MRSLSILAVVLTSVAFAISVMASGCVSPSVSSATGSFPHNRIAPTIVGGVLPGPATPEATVLPNATLTPSDITAAEDGGGNVAKYIVIGTVLSTLGAIVVGLLVGGWFLVRAERSKGD
jgi:hypothetical protein